MSTRRSARIRANRISHSTENSPVKGSSIQQGVSSAVSKQERKRKHSDDSDTLAHPGKSAKMARTREIIRIMDLPYDLFPEIFKWLDPVDLLNLSRTSKALRRLLMSRSSRDIWVQALANMPEIPKCPMRIPEPQFVNFLFGKGCMACGGRSKPGRKITDSYTRLCSKCFPVHYERIVVGSTFVNSKAYPAHIVECLDAYAWFDYNNYVFGPSELYTSRSQDKQWTKEYKALTTAKERNAWENRIVAEHKANRVISKKLSSLLSDLAEEEEEAQHELEKDAKRRIVAHLRAMGWEQEVDIHRDLRADNFNDQEDDLPKEIEKAFKRVLTPRILRNMEPSLNKYMEQRKANRLFSERRGRLLSRARTLTAVCLPLIEKLVPASEPRIQVQDIFQDQRVKDVLFNTPQEVKLEPQDFAFVEGLLPDIVQGWKDRVKISMIGLISDVMGEEYISKAGRSSVLSLATSVFSCQGAVLPKSLFIEDVKAMGFDAAHRSWTSYCQDTNESLWFEDVLSHRCCYGRRLPGEECKSPSDFLFSREPWSNKLVFKEEAKNIIDQAIGLCGLNPLTTTSAEMDELDPIFDCALCRKPTQAREVMKWRGVIQHFGLKHKGYRGPYAPFLVMLSLVSLRGDQAEDARKLITEACEKKIYHTELEVLCVHCDHSGKLAELKRHLLNQHHISNAQIGIDFQLSGKNPNCHPTDPVQMWPPYVGVVPGREDTESFDPLLQQRIKYLGMPKLNEEDGDMYSDEDIS